MLQAPDKNITITYYEHFVCVTFMTSILKFTDCGGLMCLNWGKLDKNTCQCSCPAIWGGSDCSICKFYIKIDII